MNTGNREIELKLQVLDTDIDTVVSEVGCYLSQFGVSQIIGKGPDIYWEVPGGVRGDFLRVRDRGVDREITVKARDRDNLDRLEINVTSQDSMIQVMRLFNAALGNRSGRVVKKYYIYEMDGMEGGNVCIYSLEVDKQYVGVFLEIEMRTADQVLYWERKVRGYLGAKGITTKRMPGSLYEMFISREKVG